MPEWVDLCALSEKINWRVMPDEWEDRSLWWMARLSLYLKVRERSQQKRQPMSEQQMAPYVPSREDAEAHLRSIGAL